MCVSKTKKMKNAPEQSFDDRCRGSASTLLVFFCPFPSHALFTLRVSLDVSNHSPSFQLPLLSTYPQV
ncbi:Uncharacterized protein TCM_002973 [Theobroma cacao]|uniref:Uncharacterized protein n=1 Tax=Theobroma cacao TaxID=3641 RepID=A0A061DPD2_THECC|nr:Uncharacterized protein TCM_002973 [Theobroma cacao]